MPEIDVSVGPWFRWFAWRPVLTIDRGWRWLVPVWRRRCPDHSLLGGHADRCWPHAIVINPYGRVRA